MSEKHSSETIIAEKQKERKPVSKPHRYTKTSRSRQNVSEIQVRAISNTTACPDVMIKAEEIRAFFVMTLS